MKKIVFIADYFLKHIVGGGELNNNELSESLEKRDYDVTEIQSRFITLNFLKSCKDCFIILSNFVEMPLDARAALMDMNYIIYEHDHKYLKSRNPAPYDDFKAPSSELINYNLYKNAIAVLCQSQFHKDIVQKNLGLDNIINVGGNLWSEESLNIIEKMSQLEKKDCCSIMQSNISHKNTAGTIKYCNYKDINYELVADSSYPNFLRKLGSNAKFIFLPQTPETLSRVVVEARMMGCSIMTNNLVGAASEEWFKLKGSDLIDFMRKKKEEIISTIEALITQNNRNTTEKPLVSIITTFCDGKTYLPYFLANMANQTIFDKCELIIVDANSSGNEQRLIGEYLDKYNNIVYHRLDEKLKPTPCLNKAIQIANGKYLTLALIDDVKKEDAIEILYNEIEKDDTIDLVYGDVIVTDTPNQSFESFETKEANLFEHSQYAFSKENMIKCLPGPMPLWRQTMHEKNGFFDMENCNYADDWEMWLRAIESGSKFKKVNQIVGLYLAGGRSQQEDSNQRQEEAKIFYKYSHLFGSNFYKFKPYFDQFLESYS